MKKKSKVILLSVLTIILVIVIFFFAYTANYYHADGTATDILQADVTLHDNGKQLVLPSQTSTTTGIIFYPGAKVEASAYLPLLQNLQAEGITCVILPMPFNFAIFDKNAANSVYSEFPEITHWFIAGHSLGGAMASSYFSQNSDKLDGLILLGAYVYGDNINLDDVALLYGENDKVLNREKLTATVPNTYIIEGGNHAYFGNYGEQAGDGVATISREMQQQEAASYIAGFIQQKIKQT